MNLLSVGDNVGWGKYRPHSVFRNVINFSGESGFISIVTEDVGAGPINIVVDELVPLPFGERSGEGEQAPLYLVFKDNTLMIGDRVFGVSDCPVYNSRIINAAGLSSVYPELIEGRTYHGSTSSPRTKKELFIVNLNSFKEILLRESPPLSLAFLLDKNRAVNFDTGFKKAFFEQISEGVTKLFGGDIEASVRMIKGCGFGLTPSGDDFLAGVLLGLNVIRNISMHRNFMEHSLSPLGRGQVRGRKQVNTPPHSDPLPKGERRGEKKRSNLELISTIFNASKGENPFTNAFLSMAAKGCFTEHFKRLVFCLLGDNKDDTEAAVRKVLSHGETSGADMLTGFLMTLRKGLSF